MAEKTKTLWVMSNRQDDRVVLFERDPLHPGGEAFVAGSAPAYVGRTGTVEGYLRDGLLIEVPEPAEGRKKPQVVQEAAPDAMAADAPGQVVRLGRQLDPELYPDGAPKSVQEQQERAGDEVPVPDGVIVPDAPEPQRETRRR